MLELIAKRIKPAYLKQQNNLYSGTFFYLFAYNIHVCLVTEATMLQPFRNSTRVWNQYNFTVDKFYKHIS
jgi:hypothetical protein